MKTDNAVLSDFEQFMMIRLKASTDFLEGNFDSLKDLSVTSDPATIFPPHGIYISGVSQVNDFNQKGASNFLPHAENEFEVIHQDASNSLAYWTGIQRSSVKMTGQDAPVILISGLLKYLEESMVAGNLRIGMPIDWLNSLNYI